MKLATVFIAGAMAMTSSFALAQSNSGTGAGANVNPKINSEIDAGTSTSSGQHPKGMNTDGRSSTTVQPNASGSVQMNNSNMNTTNPTCDNAAQAKPGTTNCKVNGGSGPSN
jgi:hypothetical protein